MAANISLTFCLSWKIGHLEIYSKEIKSLVRRVIQMLVVTGVIPTILSLATLITYLARSEIWQSKPVVKYMQPELWWLSSRIQSWTPWWDPLNYFQPPPKRMPSIPLVKHTREFKQCTNCHETKADGQKALLSCSGCHHARYCASLRRLLSST